MTPLQFDQLKSKKLLKIAQSRSLNDVVSLRNPKSKENKTERTKRKTKRKSPRRKQKSKLKTSAKNKKSKTTTK